jgi:hypothetical protein
MVISKKSKQWSSAAAKRLMSLAGNPATVEDAIKIVAAETIRDLPHPPLQLETVAERLNVTGITFEELPFSGELRPSNGGFTIVCSVHLSAPRRRFTIAHELSHAIFEKSGRNCPRTGAELERLCDMLATELLMPRDAFLERSGADPDINTIYELSRVFQTSITATAIRCAELLRLSAFQVEDGRVVWSHGVIKKGSLRGLDEHLKALIANGIAGGSGQQVLAINLHGSVKPWHVKYRGTKGRALFLMRPERRPSSLAELNAIAQI